MTCAACVGAVERGLSAKPGIRHVSVSLMSKSGRVRFDERELRAAEIVATVCELGYSAELQLGSEASRAADTSTYTNEAAQWRRQFQGSALFAVPIFLIAMVLPHAPLLREPLLSPVVPGLSWRVLLLWLLTTPVQFGYGWRFYKSAYVALSHGATNIDA